MTFAGHQGATVYFVCGLAFCGRASHFSGGRHVHVCKVSPWYLSVSSRSALRLILRELDLTYAIRDEVLLISTPEKLEHDTDTQVFDVSRLLREDESADELADILRYIFAPAQPRDEADEAPRPGLDFVAYRNLLIVRGKHNLFPAVEAVLTKMDVGLNGPSKAKVDARTDPSALSKPFPPDSRFAIAGHIDWNGDGVDDLPLLAHLIRSFGGTIDAIQQQDGRVVGRLTKDTDYLVRGERPTERDSTVFLASYTRIMEAAFRLKLENLSADRLFHYYNRVASQQAQPKAAAPPATKPQGDDPFNATTSDGDPFGGSQ